MAWGTFFIILLLFSISRLLSHHYLKENVDIYTVFCDQTPILSWNLYFLYLVRGSPRQNWGKGVHSAQLGSGYLVHVERWVGGGGRWRGVKLTFIQQFALNTIKSTAREVQNVFAL